MTSPFVAEPPDAEAEKSLVLSAQRGDAAALESLIRLHQPWVFNIVLRMVPDFHEAEDLCQDVLLKCFMNIASFRGESRFRTWLYRIAVNRVLSAREGPAERELKASEKAFADDDFMRRFMAQELPDDRLPPPDLDLLVQETRVKCMLGMLVCLTRRQRMVFILGDILSVGGAVAGELLGMSEVGFRKCLSRARRRLHNFMFDRCGLVNPDKPCRCERSVAANVRSGCVDPLHLVFGAEDSVAVRDIVTGARRRLDRIEYSRCGELYREHPFRDSPDFARKVLEILGSADFQALLETAPG